MIDLNGNNLTVVGNITNHGELTIKGDGVVGVEKVLYNGTLTIDGGTFAAAENKTDSIIENQAG